MPPREATVTGDVARIAAAANRTLPGATVRVSRRGGVGQPVEVTVSFVSRTDVPLIGALGARSHSAQRHRDAGRTAVTQHSDEGGNVTVFVAALMVVAMLLGLALSDFGHLAVAKSRANSAADATALAAADELALGRSAASVCAVRRRDRHRQWCAAPHVLLRHPRSRARGRGHAGSCSCTGTGAGRGRWRADAGALKERVANTSENRGRGR